MTNTYADLSMLKAPGPLDITGGSYDARLLALLEAASRWIDGYCNRHFYVLETTRKFCGGGSVLLTPDLVRVDRLRTRRDMGGAFEREWAASDYRLEPANAAPEQPWGGPYRRIAAAGKLLSRGGFPDGPASVEITGRWGYREVWQNSGVRLQPGILSAAAGSLTVTSAEGLAAGQTLRLDDGGSMWMASPAACWQCAGALTERLRRLTRAALPSASLSTRRRWPRPACS